MARTLRRSLRYERGTASPARQLLQRVEARRRTVELGHGVEDGCHMKRADALSPRRSIGGHITESSRMTIALVRGRRRSARPSGSAKDFGRRSTPQILANRSAEAFAGDSRTRTTHHAGEPAIRPPRRRTRRAAGRLWARHHRRARRAAGLRSARDARRGRRPSTGRRGSNSSPSDMLFDFSQSTCAGP